MLASGFVFDILGRKMTLVMCQVIGAILTFLFPVCSPSVAAFMVLRIIFQCIFVPIIGNPLVMDYVIVQGRGKATAMQNQGALAGNLLSVAALFTLTSKMKNYYL
jgi:MFS family permease